MNYYQKKATDFSNNLLADFITKARKTHNYSVQQLSELSGIDDRVINKAESGKGMRSDDFEAINIFLRIFTIRIMDTIRERWSEANGDISFNDAFWGHIKDKDTYIKKRPE